MPEVIIYATAVCPYCNNAERLLNGKGISNIKKIRVDLDSEKLAEMIQRTGRRTVPQIYIGNHHIGGYDDLYELDRSSKLDTLLAD